MLMCRNWRTWAVYGAVAVTVAVVWPDARATLLPLLLVAACPLSMLVMGVGMARAGRRDGDADRPVGEAHSRAGLAR